MTKQSQNLLNKKRYCYFCVNITKDMDYKQWQQLQRFTSSYGKIVPRRRSGVCLKHQRKLSKALKRARFMALLPYTTR
ncbi:30S ribosomal protein S18 [bacterium]|nr:30S ribosomal protein S18 [bacterium]MBT4121982.1 30S ribosomal protein S18 [bacterium]MBT4335652.1 30S ribosomal protein S18 [bacterium]MBT4495870.1 30S ribosomal protein S18 [bacterium]MBT4763541.1 30S ribosomal protein S18 [bacterium]